MGLTVQQKIEQYQKMLRKSKTAYSPGVDPTPQDISLQQKIISEQNTGDRAKSDELKKQWYSSADPDKEEYKTKGFLGRALKTLGAPMSAGVGAVEHAVGKGTKDSLLTNMADSVDKERTYGDLLRSTGMKNWAAMPLGLTLDILGDPINWATAGTAALIPRIAVGAKAGITSGKGLVKGVGIAAKSGLLQKAETVGKLWPGLSRRAFDPKYAAQKLKVPTLYKKISKAADAGREEYEILTNQTWQQMLAKYSSKVHISEKITKQLNKTPRGQEALEKFKYHPHDWWGVRIEDDIIKQDARLAAEEGREVADMASILNKTNAAKTSSFKDVDELEDLLYYDKGNVGETAEDFFDDLLDNKGTTDDIIAPKKVVNRQISEGMEVGVNPAPARASNSAENVLRLDNEARIDQKFKKSLKEIVDKAEKKKNMLKGIAEAKTEYQIAADKISLETRALKDMFTETGFKSFDKFMDNVIKTGYGKTTLTAYANIIGLFKTAKIGGNFLVAASNAVVGNLVMTSMAGINVANAAFYGNIKKAASIARGKDLNALKELLGGNQGGTWENFIKDFSGIFTSVFGINSDFALRGSKYVDEVVEDILGKITYGNKEEMAKYYKEADDIKAFVKESFSNKSTLTASQKDFAKTATGKARARMRTVTQREAVSPVATALDEGVDTIQLTQEVLEGPFASIVKGVEERALRTGSPFIKALSWYLKGPMDAYGKIDQIYRLGLALHLTKSGIGPAELRTLSKTYKLAEADVTKIVGRNLWTVTPMKATELASKIYMNYQAMPGFVKMMRVAPLVGSPFISFSYGMTALTAQTAVHNPAFFNKARLALKEFSGEKSPLEKEALNSKYHSWLDKEGMVKLPFYKDNPVYLNMEQKLPYYTLNLFQNAERTYDSRFSTEAVGLLDKLPFLKEPGGQVLLDYALLPLLTGKSQGMFGQQLWSKDAGLLEKAGRAAQAGVETVVPPLFSLPLSATPEKYLGLVPSYRARQLGNAARGKTSLGIESSTPASELKNRTLGSIAGWGTHKINLRNK